MLATVHREANVRPERLRRIVEGLGRSTLPVVFPAHPRTRACVAEQAIDAGTADHADRAARLPRLRRARLAGRRDRDRLGRPAEGGVLVRRPLRDDAALDGVGRHRRGRARTCSSTTTPTGSRPPSRARMPAERPRSTATAMPRADRRSRPLSTATATRLLRRRRYDPRRTVPGGTMRAACAS